MNKIKHSLSGLLECAVMSLWLRSLLRYPLFRSLVSWKLCLALGGLGFLEFNMKSLVSSLQSLNKIPLLSLTVAVCKGGKQYISLQRDLASEGEFAFVHFSPSKRI